MEQNKNNGTTSAAKWKEVLIGGVSGIALGTAGTLFASSVPLEASAETPETPDSEDANIGNGGENVTAQMATCVTDSMSFSAAFGAAFSSFTGSLFANFFLTTRITSSSIELM